MCYCLNMYSENTDGVQPTTKRTFIEEARRSQIVAAAIETLAELGYGKASMAQIAKRAQIAPASSRTIFVTRMPSSIRRSSTSQPPGRALSRRRLLKHTALATNFETISPPILPHGHPPKPLCNPDRNYVQRPHRGWNPALPA